jgi:ferredoxin
MAERPAPEVTLIAQNMPRLPRRIPKVSAKERHAVPLRPKAEALANIHAEVELGFTVEHAIAEAERCLNCDFETVFTASLCVECKACETVCPTDSITFTKNGDEPDLRAQLRAPAKNTEQDLYVSSPLLTGRVMVKDEDICLHCGLCADAIHA